MQEEIVFKGSRSGLRVILANTAAYVQIKQMLRAKLAKSANFFQKGTVIALDADWLDEQQKQEITELFKEYGLVLTQVIKQPEEQGSAEAAVLQGTAAPATKASGAAVQAKTAAAAAPATTKAALPQAAALKTTVINQTIRNGQEVISEGSVIINGNVNPGATVIACGNIEVYGSCRGIVHAGAFGDMDATVSANHLIPIQIRIGNLVAKAPQSNMSKNDAPYPEKASVRDGKIILTKLTRKLTTAEMTK